MTDLATSGTITEFGKITANTVTTIYTATGATPIKSIVCCENAGSTPTLTLETYDVTNTTSYYKRKAVAMTAGTEIIFNEPFTLPANWAIRITSSDAAGKIDWTLNYQNPAAAGRLR